jgi:hypothetical protein
MWFWRSLGWPAPLHPSREKKFVVKNVLEVFNEKNMHRNRHDPALEYIETY